MRRIAAAWLVALLLVPFASADTIEDRLNRLERQMQRIEQKLDALIAAGKITVAPLPKGTVVGNAVESLSFDNSSSYMYLFDKRKGSIKRVDKRDGEVRPVYDGKPGLWSVFDLGQDKSSNYIYFLDGTGGKLLRMDKRDGEVRTVYDGKPGQWERIDLGDKANSNYAYIIDKNSGTMVRIDRRDGEARVTTGN